MNDDRKVLLVFVPFFAAGVLLHLWRPVDVFSTWWIGAVAGVAVLAVAVWQGLPALRSEEISPNRLHIAAAFAYLAGSLLLNSIWPIALLLPALIFVIKWRVIQVQTGRRQPPPP